MPKVSVYRALFWILLLVFHPFNNAKSDAIITDFDYGINTRGLSENIQIYELDREVWIGTEEGIWKAGVETRQAEGSAVEVKKVGDSIWLMTKEGIWKAGDETRQAEGWAREVKKVGDGIWLMTKEGIWKAGNLLAGQALTALWKSAALGHLTGR
ncbi:MAG: hypothetical protein V7727_21860 [Sneathiella sp.]